MTFPDQAWDAALENWAPTGSFHAPLTAPAHGPADGTLVQLPCVNQEWVLLIMGCISQLQNPNIWGLLADSVKDQVLSWVTQLQEMIWGAEDMGCCDISMRLTAECGLQFSTDGGTTWTDVSNWSTNFCPCASACIIFPVPPNPNNDPVQQHACNIAGYLATDIIKIAMEKVVAYVGTTSEQVQFATDVLSTIGYAFPITYAASIAFRDWYNSVVTQVLAQVEAARDDPALWSLVTCAIYSAIRAVGYVNATNFAAVHTNLAAMSYTYSWVPAVIAAWWNDMGLQNIQQAQNVGAIDVVDCSACPTTWCYEWDFTISDGGFTRYPGTLYGVWVPGIGWEMEHAGGSVGAIEIALDVPGSSPITEIKAHIFANSAANAAIGGLVRPSPFAEQSFNFSTYGGPFGDGSTNVSAGTFTVPYRRLDIFFRTTAWVSSASNWVIQRLSITGTGVNPFGPDNCTF